MADGRREPALAVSLVLTLGLTLATGCAPDTGPSYYLFDSGDHTAIAVPDPASDRARDGWTAGPPIPLHEVGRIAIARVWGDTLVGIYDGLACQVHLLALRDDVAVETLARLSRCGDGPGELRGATDLYLDRDTLIVADHERNRLVLFSVPDGGVRTLRLEPTADDPWRASGILLASGDTFDLNGSLGVGWRAADGLLRRIAREDGRLLADFLGEAAAVRSNPAPMLRQVWACADRDTRRFVVASRWRVERAVLTPQHRVAAGPFLSELDWVGETPYDDRPGVRPAAFVRVACGGGKALLMWRTLGAGNVIDRYYLEVLDTGGRVLYQEHGRSPGNDHPASHTVAGAVADGWLGYTNNSDLGPVLRVFSVRAQRDAGIDP